MDTATLFVWLVTGAFGMAYFVYGRKQAKAVPPGGGSPFDRDPVLHREFLGAARRLPTFDDIAVRHQSVMGGSFCS